MKISPSTGALASVKPALTASTPSTILLTLRPVGMVVQTGLRAGIEGGTWKADKADTKMGTDFLP